MLTLETCITNIVSVVRKESVLQWNTVLSIPQFLDILNKSNQKSPPSPPPLNGTLQFYAHFLGPVFRSEGGEIGITDNVLS